MRVFFINNEGGGFSDFVEVAENTSYKSFFTARMGSADPAKFKIRVTRQGNRFTPEGEGLVMEGDQISITPAKITGYQG